MEKKQEFEIEVWGKYKIIWIDSDRLDKCLEYYKMKNLDGIGISPYSGFKLDNLNFLEKYEEIQGLILVYSQKFDYKPIYKLKNLRFISLDDNSELFDYSLFSELEEIRSEWHKKISLPYKSEKLKSLYFSKFKPKAKLCVQLPEFPNLENLEFVQSTIVSLEGLEKFKKLKKLSVSYCPKLTDISGILELPLEVLEFENCKKIENFEGLSSLKHLKIVKLSNCGKISSLKFIENLKKLEHLSFVDTTIDDGDLNLCLKLKSVGFMNKKHYSHTYEEIKQIIESRNK